MLYIRYHNRLLRPGSQIRQHYPPMYRFKDGTNTLIIIITKYTKRRKHKKQAINRDGIIDTLEYLSGTQHGINISVGDNAVGIVKSPFLAYLLRAFIKRVVSSTGNGRAYANALNP